jgi:hypothetical protein
MEPWPAAIVVQTGDAEWRIATLAGADQINSEPTVLLYEFAPGLPYRSVWAASCDAMLVLKRQS